MRNDAVLHHVNIQYPVNEMENSRRRMNAAYRFEPVDQVPVFLGIEARYLLRERGVSFAEYFSDPGTQLIHQLENTKWRIENIPDDWFTQPALTISPDFQNVTNASGCGAEIFWQDNETPQAIPCIGTLDELIHHRLPDWRGTLWGKKLEWFQEMKNLLQDVRVTLNGEDIPVFVTLGINADSPFMTAIDLADSNFYNWILEAPDECKTFLEKVTDRYIEVETGFRQLTKRPMNDGLMYSDDSAQIISLDQYREFCVPVGKRLYGAFGNDRYDGRAMHLCGRNAHLHEALLHDLHITQLTGYGSGNGPEEMKLLAGKVILHGNIDPMTLYQGSKGDIVKETEKILHVLGSYAGIILGDGYNIVPGSPLSNLETIKQTSATFGIRLCKN
jgi:uroporphyrinogen-III decarboxylase